VRNVTITLDDETARWARIEAAKRDTSVSRLVGSLLRQHMQGRDAYDQARLSYSGRSARLLSAPGAAYPSRDDVHARGNDPDHAEVSDESMRSLREVHPNG